MNVLAMREYRLYSLYSLSYLLKATMCKVKAYLITCPTKLCSRYKNNSFCQALLYQYSGIYPSKASVDKHTTFGLCVFKTRQMQV